MELSANTIFAGGKFQKFYLGTFGQNFFFCGANYVRHGDIQNVERKIGVWLLISISMKRRYDPCKFARNLQKLSRNWRISQNVGGEGVSWVGAGGAGAPPGLPGGGRSRRIQDAEARGHRPASGREAPEQVLRTQMNNSEQ